MTLVQYVIELEKPKERDNLINVVPYQRTMASDLIDLDKFNVKKV